MYAFKYADCCIQNLVAHLSYRARTHVKHTHTHTGNYEHICVQGTYWLDFNDRPRQSSTWQDTGKNKHQVLRCPHKNTQQLLRPSCAGTRTKKTRSTDISCSHFSHDTEELLNPHVVGARQKKRTQVLKFSRQQHATYPMKPKCCSPLVKLEEDWERV